MQKEPQHIQEILQGLGIAARTWQETRGRKIKYSFILMRKGETIKKIVPLKKARTIQTAMKNAANREKVLISIQNHGSYLLIKRMK